jgi:hypothetical protein
MFSTDMAYYNFSIVLQFVPFIKSKSIPAVPNDITAPKIVTYLLLMNKNSMFSYNLIQEKNPTNTEFVGFHILQKLSL